jgi:hypothetical protein
VPHVEMLGWMVRLQPIKAARIVGSALIACSRHVELLDDNGALSSRRVPATKKAFLVFVLIYALHRVSSALL